SRARRWARCPWPEKSSTSAVPGREPSQPPARLLTSIIAAIARRTGYVSPKATPLKGTTLAGSGVRGGAPVAPGPCLRPRDRVERDHEPERPPRHHALDPG